MTISWMNRLTRSRKTKEWVLTPLITAKTTAAGALSQREKQSAKKVKRVNEKVTDLDRACLVGEMVKLLLH